MKNINEISLLVLLASFVVPNGTIAGKSDDEKKSPTITTKFGKEAARVVGQVEKAGEEIEKGWKSQRNKDKEVLYTFRTTGVKGAVNHHSAISIQFPNAELQGAAHELIVNHRTVGKGSVIKGYLPSQEYIELGTLPSSVNFRDTIFDISSWAQAIRHASSDTSVVATYLSFAGDPNDIHSCSIRSGKRILKEVILGNDASENQPGIHVYGPETDQNTNEWSIMQKERIPQ